jgi:hypothetical protein
MISPWLSRAALATAVLACVLAGAPRGLSAQEGTSEPVEALLGSYRNVAEDDGRAAIEAAVDTALEPANAVLRAMARGRILDNNPSVHRLVIERQGQAIQVSYDGTRSYRAALGGAAGVHRAPDGTRVRVRYSVDGGRLVEVVDSGRGHARSTYAREGEELVMSTIIASPHLPKRVRFRLRFRPE